MSARLELYKISREIEGVHEGIFTYSYIETRGYPLAIYWWRYDQFYLNDITTIIHGLD